jgi:predicted enzyme related to lactoylglutathione lyase
MASLAFKGHTIFCTDVMSSARFYEEVLGFTREWADDSHISLLAPVADSADATVSLLLHPGDRPEPIDLGTFETDDVDALIEKARAAGCAIGTEPTDSPWGVREASVSDPDGNGLYITGPLQTAAR